MGHAEKLTLAIVLYAVLAWLDLQVKIDYSLYLAACGVLLIMAAVNWYKLALEVFKEMGADEWY